MKLRHVCLLLALLAALLLLAGCRDGTLVETPAPETLSAPADGSTVTASAAPTEFPAEAELPELECHSWMYPLVHGPAGAVSAISFGNTRCNDPVYGDLDGDGQKELVYRCAAAYRGSTCEAIVAYGLEDGWPIQKGCAVLRIANARTALTEQNGKVFYSWQNSAFGQKEPLLLPVKLVNGSLLLNKGRLPEGLLAYDEEGTIYGWSFRTLKSMVGSQALTAEQEYFIWKEPGALNSSEYMNGLEMTCAVMTTNGVTVTGAVFWRTEPDGSHDCTVDGASAPSVRDPDTLLGKTEKELTDKLGFPAFARSTEDGAAVLYWFTEQGKLLSVRIEERSVSAELTDLPVEDAP